MDREPVYSDEKNEAVAEEMNGVCEVLERDLAERASRLQAILDTTVDGMLTIDERGIVQSFNKAAERIFGYMAGEVIGQKVNMLQPAPYCEEHDAYIANYLRTGEGKIIGRGREVEGRRKDGTVFPLYLAVSEVWVGSERYFTGIIRDITQQKLATSQIKSLARFPEESPDPVIRVRRDGVILYANARSKCLLDTWGCGTAQLLPDPWRKTVLDSLDAGTIKEIDINCGELTYSLVIAPIPDADDVNIYGRDITERNRAEQALRESEEKHRVLVEHSSDAILLISEDRRIISCNQAFLDLFGYDKADVEGQSMRLIHASGNSFRSFYKQARPYLESFGSFRIEWEFQRKDGVLIPTEETLSVIRNPNGSIRGFVAVIRDITERKQAEWKLQQYRDHLEEMVWERTKELEEAHKALLHEEKLKILGTISAEMAHEIRNPLVSIGGFARRLKQKLQGVPEIEIVVQESERLEGILKRIENYLKPVELRPKECMVNEVIEEAVGLLWPELNQEGIEMDMNLTPQITPAYVDPGVLLQVVINVIRNAAKVMDKQGKIIVQTIEGDQSIQVNVQAPVLGLQLINSELPFMPFSEDRHGVSVPVCFRLLRGMGGRLSLKQDENSIAFAASLLKAFRPTGKPDGSVEIQAFA